MIPSLSEIAFGVFGAWRLAHLDRKGMAYFDQSPEGFWKSFFAAVVVAPGHVLVVALDLADVELSVGPGRLVTLETLAYVISWTAFPVVMHHLARNMGKEPQFIGYIVALNWAKIIQMAAYLPVSVLRASEILPLWVASLLILGVGVAILAYEWFIARAALGVNGATATGLVVLNLFIGIVIAFTVTRMIA